VESSLPFLYSPDEEEQEHRGGDEIDKPDRQNEK
jgi:hypothetical protein